MRRATATAWRRATATALGTTLVAACVLGLGSSASASTSGPADVWQVGTYDYLTNPANYTGLAPLDVVTSGRTLGLGTFDHLDGEMILVGGTAWRVGTDGHPLPADATRTTPFAQAIAFRPDASGPVAPGTTCSQLTAAINALAGTAAGEVAVRVRGTFTDLVTRSVAAQPEPYPPLSQAVAAQTVFPLGRQRAVLVGFRTGPDMAGTGAPGLHLHGVTASRDAGGHVLSCVAGDDVELSIERASGVRVLSATGGD